MYYLIYGLLYLFSLLPLRFLYWISDFLFFIVYYIVQYRKKIVLDNLEIAFPEKSITEKKIIAKQFYKNFVDTFVETIKMISISDKAFHKMVEMDLSKVIALANEGKSIQFHAGHQFNWELANWKIAEKMPIPFVGVYMRISNRHFDKIFYDLRAKKGTVLVEVKEFRSKMHQFLNTQYSIGLAADQNPADAKKGFWLNFFNKPVPFVTGPDKAAIKNKTAVVFVRLIKIKRGKYKFETEIITEQASCLKEGELTCLYRDMLEDTIRKYPSNYLWSHRRWKRPFTEEFQKQWIDRSEFKK
jgi:KDO2-lipid IV(A) lauroyltransferase